MNSRYDLVMSGEIDRRTELLVARLKACDLCPRVCGVDRTAGETGICGTAGAVVSAATAHFGEEPEITGRGGSGTIFFAGCNLRCIYCQNWEISQGAESAVLWNRAVDTPSLAATMLRLQAAGCANINLVTPSHVAPMAMDAVAKATRDGLVIPIVWNSSGYDSVDTIRMLDGIVDIYLPDLRYSDNFAAAECSAAPDYVERSRESLLEMARQVGVEQELAPDGTLRRGMVVRLLVLPNDMSGVRESLDFIKANLGTRVRVAIMSQYFPSHLAVSNDLLCRQPTPNEYYRVVDYAAKLGFDNALVQDMEASEFYRPDFGRKDEPFVDARHFRKG